MWIGIETVAFCLCAKISFDKRVKAKKLNTQINNNIFAFCTFLKLEYAYEMAKYSIDLVIDFSFILLYFLSVQILVYLFVFSYIIHTHTF